MTQSIDTVSEGIGSTVADVLRTDIALLRGYSDAKARAIAQFTLLIAEAYAAGEITAAQLAAEREELRRMVARFARNIAALAATTMERLIGRLLEFLTGRIGLVAAAAGMAVPPALALV